MNQGGVAISRYNMQFLTQYQEISTPVGALARNDSSFSTCCRGLSHESNIAQKTKLSFRASAHTGVGISRIFRVFSSIRGIATPVTSVTGSQ